MLFSYHLLYFCTALSPIIMLSSHYHHHKSKTFSQLTQCPFTGTLLLFMEINNIFIVLVHLTQWTISYITCASQPPQTSEEDVLSLLWQGWQSALHSTLGVVTYFLFDFIAFLWFGTYADKTYFEIISTLKNILLPFAV